MIAAKRQNRSSSKRGYIFNSILFFGLILLITDCLVKRAHDIPRWKKLNERQVLRVNFLNLKKHITIAGESLEIDKTIVTNKTTSIIQVRKMGDITCFYCRSFCGDTINETEEHVSPQGIETMSRVFQNSAKNNLAGKLNRMIVERAKSAELNLDSLKNISTGTIRQLYEIPESTHKVTKKWKKEMKRGITGAIENLKKYQ